LKDEQHKGDVFGHGHCSDAVNSALAQSPPTMMQSDQPNRIFIEYGQPYNSAFQELYGLLRERRALERMQEILSPLRVTEQLTIKTAECGAVNSYYNRENFQPIVTICYELLKQILDSLPKDTTPAGVAAADAAIGQFFFVTLHEVGHAALIFSACQYLEMRRTRPTILQHTLCCNLAEHRHDD